MSSNQDRYQISETLGAGATSRVDKARDTLIGRVVALKTLRYGLGSADIEKQFLREAQIVGSLAHPHIVSLYDVGFAANGMPCLVMEYVEGKTLEQALQGGPVPLKRAAVWAADLATALEQAHQAGIIHGDVKPANVLITNEVKGKAWRLWSGPLRYPGVWFGQRHGHTRLSFSGTDTWKDSRHALRPVFARDYFVRNGNRRPPISGPFRH